MSKDANRLTANSYIAILPLAHHCLHVCYPESLYDVNFRVGMHVVSLMQAI